MNTLTEEWDKLRAAYERVREEHREDGQSFTSWGLANIDPHLITRIGKHVHATDFNSLPADKAAELRKVAKAFATDPWMIYFVLEKSLITQSIKGLKLILRIKRGAEDLTLKVLRDGLEKAREERRGIRQRNVSNDITKFTYNDIKIFQRALFLVSDSYQVSGAGSINSATSGVSSATSQFMLDPEPVPDTPPLLERSLASNKAARHINPILLGNDITAQNPQRKRQRTATSSPNASMDEISPQKILDTIATIKNLSPLSPDTILGRPSMVDCKVWVLLQRSITDPVESEPTIDSTNVIRDLGFPCAVKLLESFHRSEDIAYSGNSSGTNLQEYVTNGYLFYLCNCESAARFAMTSAQALGDLICCSRYVVQTLMRGHNRKTERLRGDVTPSSFVMRGLMRNIEKETVVLITSLDVLFRRSEVMVSELTSFIIDVQRTKKQLLTDCGS